MESLIGATAALSLVLAMVALWKVLVLTKELARVKREHYYVDTRVKRVPEEITAAVEPLRWQLANVIAGKPVLPDLVLSGRPYVDIPAQEAKRLLDADGGPSRSDIVIDVRTAKEYAAKRIPGSKLLPFEELDQRYRNEISDRADRVFVYCTGGERSRLACDFLGRRGYTNVYNIEDGLRAWRGPTEGEGEVTFIKLELKR